ncbi:fructoselysine-6-P-deglycase FrlB-like protein [Ruminiclostridium sufflavum DSM 19573]|uniref:Fructoselysine-6-P-deglycase FrlB-like protein n=1 Tax=Ruminiclostridium sufflavum DSM 19573 TaxID=1121337 RepID=A0A318XUP4_9FIRM|nr:SIS domain-containing protein [Ruminiclostridium sufflavum]PYG90400.1 fructoselysine-6-P-deglycase FrlB-like protein [Ruminiclostridium sufflavum DSM 19573]
MYKAENEILTQYSALYKTYKYLLERQDNISGFYKECSPKRITFIGSGSSLSLCKSTALSAKLRLDIDTNVIAAGDLMMNFEFYENMIRNSLIIIPSRSGSTSEVLLAVKTAKQKLGLKSISICAVEHSELSKLSDVNLALPWAFDESICQTRTVTNLYTANLMLIAIITGDTYLIEEIGKAIEIGDDLLNNIMPDIKRLGEGKWENAVVLADAELEGIAEEGALAFKEICQRQSNYYHILDVRHGPMVIINEKTLVIIALTPYGRKYQEDIIYDLKAKGCTVITVGNGIEAASYGDYGVELPAFKNYAVNGIPFILVPQMLTLHKALAEGINPDRPEGLNPWIKL